MKLVETEEVDLDAAVTTYLPDFAVAGPGAERITIATCSTKQAAYRLSPVLRR